VIDGATAVGATAPAPRSGDFTVCLYCGAMLRFVGEDTDATLQVATPSELAELAANERQLIARVSQIIRFLRGVP
jgi:hypothetical protein